MSAIEIEVIEGKVILKYEEKTPENIDRRLNQLKASLGVTWHGVAVVFGLKPNDDTARLFRRWCRSPEQSSYQEMPETQWKLLLALVDGQESIKFK